MNKTLTNIFVAGILISAPLYPSWIKTPNDLSLWLKENFTYQVEEEGEDYWKTPKETVRDKGGDCEDFAFLVDKILSDLGYKTKVIAIYLKTNKKFVGHAICLININNKVTYFSNQYYFSEPFDNINNLLENHYPNWDSYYTMYQDGQMVNYIKR